MKIGLPIYLALLCTIAVGMQPTSSGAALLQYTGLGFQHIIPEGLDHIFFVLGLFFLSRNVITLLWQVTAFTFAHSLTFGLSLYGFVEAPVRVVEVAVALSIAFIAVENLFSDQLSRWRPWIVFGFGLIHGLAFAHTFREHTVPVQNFATALLAYNVGIELAQIAVVVLAMVVFGVWWQRPWYRRAVSIPASCIIALVSVAWVVTRFLE